VDAAELTAFLAEHRLPDRFRIVLDRICAPLAVRARNLHDARRRTVAIGLCGAQGSGKSTIAAAVVRLLAAEGLAAVAVSLDDFYLSRSARERLARDVHPLLVTRGPPGTHDVALAAATLDRLHSSGEVVLPAFDKAADEPRPRSAWRTCRAPVDVVVLEGWCVGAAPEDEAALITPVNTLEAAEDADGRWRRFVNDQLAGAYFGLFARLDDLVLLKAAGFEVVLGWRQEQEHKLIASRGHGMSDTEIARFIQHYERLTRWILAEMPPRAGLVIPLDAAREPA
jgi:D-glycerate 3-kinase